MGSRPGGVNRRKQQRMSLGVPVRIQGHDPNGTPWTEMSMTENADFGGAAFPLRHPVTRGNALHLSLPLPKSFRSYDLTAASYGVYAIVRNTNVLPNGGFRVGVMFLGRHPPRGHAQNPGGLYLLPTDLVSGAASGAVLTGAERRSHPRYDLAVQLKLTRPEPVTFGPVSEQTLTRNIGSGGAMVITSLPVSRNDIVIVEDLQGILRTRAEVRGVFIGKDNVPRLNLRFLDTTAEEAARALLRQNAIYE
jgi:PilZ domain-containing protein